MRRLVAVATAIAFMAATPVFAQGVTSANGSSSSASNSQSDGHGQSLLLGQDAYAQQDPNDPNDVFNGGSTAGLIAFSATGALIIIGAATLNHNNNNRSVSP